MVGFRCIQVFLFVILLLQFTAANEQMYIYGRDGATVTLPCTNVKDDQDQCDGTTWTFNRDRKTPAIELINLGKITKHDLDKSDRLSITKNCSLVLNKVKDEDIGLYSCRQYDRSGPERGHGSLVQLSIVSLTERHDGDDVTFICSVSTRGQCPDKVKWMYNDIEIENSHPDIKISKSSCEANITFNREKFFYTPNLHLFKCSVRHDKQTQEFPFRRLSSENQRDDDGTNDETNRSGRTFISIASELWWIVLVGLGFIALVIALVVFIKWKKRKGKERKKNGDVVLTSSPGMTQSAPQTSHELADPEDAVPYASVSYTKKADTEARVLNKDDDDDDDTVTYTSVKASSSSPAASTDHSNLYATVNKNR